MSKIYINRYYNTKDIYDKLVFNSVSLDEYKNNKVVIKNLGDAIENIITKEHGYTLITISIGKLRNTILMISYFTTRKIFLIASITNKSDLESPLSFKIEEDNNKEDLQGYISNISDEHSELSYEDIVYTMITKTLKGYRINKQIVDVVIKKLETFQSYDSELIYNDSDMQQFYSEEHKLILHTIESIVKAKENIRAKIQKFIDINKVTDFVQGEVYFGGIGINHGRIVTTTTIKDVIELGNTRIALLQTITKPSTSNNYRISFNIVRLYSYNQGRTTISVNDKGQYYKFRANRNIHYSFRNGTLGYNYLDKGRVFVSVYNMFNIFTIGGVDPTVNSDHLTFLKSAIEKESIEEVKLNVTPGDMNFPVRGSQSINLRQYTKENYGFQTILKGLKVLSDEYKYLICREKSDGQDLSVTDQITYLHSEGKLICNDFSIATDSESLKADIYNFCKNATRKHYRDPSYASQDIMDGLLDNIFKAINNMLIGGNIGSKFNIILNDKVNVEVESNKGKNNFSYVNEHRVNKSEIMPILKEMTCYRDQKVADTFIANIAKIGLSVYIGITSGYKEGEHLFRFKKGVKRSEFKLCVDDTEIYLKGKKILNLLFESKIGKRGLSKSTINDTIYSCSVTPYDYIKYRLLIDESYKLFIQRSKEFLDKKVNDTGSEYVKYHEKHKNKLMDGIKVVGSSGNVYVIAYNSEDSLVYMNPDKQELDDGIPQYEEGNYICMIDQSSIKSNIGYDTVISKMMALKHDSTVASSIYNLEDELNKKE